jgi:hypothetical protein
MGKSSNYRFSIDELDPVIDQEEVLNRKAKHCEESGRGSKPEASESLEITRVASPAPRLKFSNHFRERQAEKTVKVAPKQLRVT